MGVAMAMAALGSHRAMADDGGTPVQGGSGFPSLPNPPEQKPRLPAGLLLF